MVKINQGLSDFQEPEEGEQYQITATSENTSKGFKGISIEFTPKKQTEQNAKIKYRITAWLGQNDTVGTRSKLGSFISAFTDYFETTKDSEGVPLDTETALNKAQDTDIWKGHFIKIISWRAKNREIKVIS
jgi:hypothetical protein